MMKRLLICAVLLGACAQEPAEPNAGPPAELAPVTLPLADQAGNRMEALTQASDLNWCTEDRAWCARMLDDSQIAIAHTGVAPTTLDITGVQENGSWSVWPNIIRNTDGSAIVGVIRMQNQMFSGGGAEAGELTLYSIASGAAQEAGVLPYIGAIMLRACFNEEDQRTRSDACHDEYDFATRISLNEAAASGPAQILLETAATTFPGQLNRNADSTEAPPLEAADLVRWADPACSYRRTYIRGADGRYAPDQPLPDCSQYLEP
jgi:hypothetical protein